VPPINHTIPLQYCWRGFLPEPSGGGHPGHHPFLEADKPLPGKYCFLLFKEKREVELV
jgi:hypothetical protein